MGRHRSDIQTSTKNSKAKNKSPRRSPHRIKSREKPRDIQQGGNSIRIIQDRRVHKSCCSDPETQKGIGAVVFTLGIPSLIAGLIMTIVAATDDDNENKYPRAFIAAGPVLLVLSVVLFITGTFLHSLYIRKAFLDCFSLDNPDSFCRVRCPALSQLISPDETIVINQSAMRALQTEPGKPVLKRNRLLSDPSSFSASLDKNDNNNVITENNDVFFTENETANCNNDTQNGRRFSRTRRNSRGVRFSDGDLDESKRNRTSSITSDNGSLVSLKHCKIHPINEDIWWTEERASNLSLEMGKTSTSKEKVSTLQTTEL